jgi:hypothetical protein
MKTDACVLCGHDKPTDVRVSLARWREPEGAMYSAVPRCIDRKACRERCEASGDDWPVIDPYEVSVVPI